MVIVPAHPCAPASEVSSNVISTLSSQLSVAVTWSANPGSIVWSQPAVISAGIFANTGSCVSITVIT